MILRPRQTNPSSSSYSSSNPQAATPSPSPSPSPTPTPPTSRGWSKSKETGIILGIVIASVFILLVWGALMGRKYWNGRNILRLRACLGEQHARTRLDAIDSGIVRQGPLGTIQIQYPHHDPDQNQDQDQNGGSTLPPNSIEEEGEEAERERKERGVMGKLAPAAAVGGSKVEYVGGSAGKWTPYQTTWAYCLCQRPCVGVRCVRGGIAEGREERIYGGKRK